MITFLTTAPHAYTVDGLLAGDDALALGVMHYEQVLTGADLPPATYIFTDIDRLPLPRQLQAAELYRRLADPRSGCRAVNDPARVRSRYGLLRTLFRNGLNAFNAYHLDEGARPRRFPVFVRLDWEHRGPLTDLLPDQAALERAVAALVERGVPAHAMLIVEYCGEPVERGIYRRQAAYRVGERVFAGESVHEGHWCVKDGALGIARHQEYCEELASVREFRYAEHMMRAFRLGGVEYGRVDFGIVQGQPQVYEINTNPRVGSLREHPSAERMEAHALVRANLLAALAALDTVGARD